MIKSAIVGLAAFGVSLSLSTAGHAQRWLDLPSTPPPISGGDVGTVAVPGGAIYYHTIGSGTPVLLLHGGLANSDYFGYQAAALAHHHLVILIDSRGHGRSLSDDRPVGYDLMADDVLATLDALHIAQADVVGWSDGAIIGLDLAMRSPTRIRRLFAFAPNADLSGVKGDIAVNPTFAAFLKRARAEYSRMSPTPAGYTAFERRISTMWETQPHWTDEQLAKITSPVQIVDGDHDEAIYRSHVEHIAAAIPGAGLLILPNASHFAFLQDPELFNAAVADFLDH